MHQNIAILGVTVGVALSSSIGLANEPTVKQLKKARTEIEVDGAILSLEGRVWRESPPGSSAGDAPLQVALKLKTGGNKRFPVGLKVTKVWLVLKNEVWSPTEHTDQVAPTEPGQPSTAMSILATNGPKWKLGAKVMCVVQMETTDGGEGMLKVGGVAIGSTR